MPLGKGSEWAQGVCGWEGGEVGRTCVAAANVRHILPLRSEGLSIHAVTCGHLAGRADPAAPIFVLHVGDRGSLLP